MEPTAQNMQALSHYLQQTLSADPAVRREAEAFLQSVETNQGYPLLLMHAADQATLDPVIRLSAAITFKNFVKRNWVVEEGLVGVHPTDRQAIKAQIVDLMLRLPGTMQKQISDAIAIIGKHDFPAQWSEMLPYMVTKFASGDFNMINGVLQTAHPLFKRYRYEERSDKLWTEIALVLSQFAEPLTQLFCATVDLLTVHAANPTAMKTLFNSLLLIAKLFYSLNAQDLPAYFEDNMALWMDKFMMLLNWPHSAAPESDEPDQPSMLEMLKAQICENIALYAQKYDEDFAPYMEKFVAIVWQLLTATGADAKYDQLVSTALGFLSSACQRENYKALFAPPATLQSICENVIVPNVIFRESDKEMFEDDPEEYIRRDIEGSDIDTRRRGASDLVRALCEFFEAPVTEIFAHYIGIMLQEYAANPKGKWKSKDAAVFLMTSVAVRGQVRELGTTKTNQLINVVDFFVSNVLGELQAANVNENCILRADALKYAMTFRNQLPRDLHLALLPLTAAHLLSTNTVVNTYAAGCLEKTMTMRAGGQHIITAADLAPLLQTLLTNLFTALEQPNNHENEYIMKAIMRLVSISRTDLGPYVMIIVNKLSHVLVEVAKNPSKPRFNHYLFEALGCSIKYTCASNPVAISSFEEHLFPVFEGLLANDVVEFQPYVFQLLAQMLEMRTGEVPPPYMALFPHLTFPALWQSNANTSPLVRLLQAYIRLGKETIFPTDATLTSLLGVFQRLILSRTNDVEGFNLANVLVESLPVARLQQFFPTILTLLFQRMQSSKTVRFVKGLLVFICMVAAKYGGPMLVHTVDGLQASLFAMVLNRLLEDTQKVTGDVEKKICAAGVANLLCETPEMLTTYAQLWPKLLSCIVSLFELPEDDSGHVDEEAEFASMEEQEYRATFAKLAFAGRPDHDPFPQIADSKVYFIKMLHAAATRQPGQIGPRVHELPQQTQTFIQGYLQRAGLGPLP